MFTRRAALLSAAAAVLMLATPALAAELNLPRQKVDLVAPDGSVYVLHNRTGGSSNDIKKTYTVDLSGESLNGAWNLRVKDNGAGDTGTLNSWSVTF